MDQKLPASMNSEIRKDQPSISSKKSPSSSPEMRAKMSSNQIAVAPPKTLEIKKNALGDNAPIKPSGLSQSVSSAVAKNMPDDVRDHITSSSSKSRIEAVDDADSDDAIARHKESNVATRHALHL